MIRAAVRVDAVGLDRIIEWGWAGRGLETPSGDLHVVVPFTGGALVALLDGLGHGTEAAAASSAARTVLLEHAEDPLLRLVERCHDALKKTRGVVMSLASFRSDDSSMTWLGVGNVEGVLVRGSDKTKHPDQTIALRGGVVGSHLPPLRSKTLVVSLDDTLIMATDGIRSGFTSGRAVEYPPQEIAESILARFARGTDDAHVIVARFLGGGS